MPLPIAPITTPPPRPQLRPGSTPPTLRAVELACMRYAVALNFVNQLPADADAQAFITANRITRQRLEQLIALAIGVSSSGLVP